MYDLIITVLDLFIHNNNIYIFKQNFKDNNIHLYTAYVFVSIIKLCQVQPTNLLII